MKTFTDPKFKKIELVWVLREHIRVNFENSQINMKKSFGHAVNWRLSLEKSSFQGKCSFEK